MAYFNDPGGTAPMVFTVEQYLGFYSTSLSDLEAYADANTASFIVQTNIVDYSDDTRFSGVFPGLSPWPAAEATGRLAPSDSINNTFFDRITAQFSVDVAGTYTFQTFNDDGLFLLIDGALVINDPFLHSPSLRTGSVDLSEGVHSLELFHFELGGEAVLELSVRRGSGDYELVGDPDTVLADTDDWLVWTPGTNVLTGYGGTDTAAFWQAEGPVSAFLGSNHAVVAGQFVVLSGIENLSGSRFSDLLAGNAGDNILRGRDGNDILQGSAGADRMLGGDGSDFVSYLNVGSAVHASLLRGTGFAGDAAGDVYDSIEGLSGSRFADTLTGGTGGDTLFGGEGDDVLTGNAGNDWLRGHTGTDMAVFSYASDQYSVTTNGFRTVVDYTGPGAGSGTDTLDHVEILRFADGDLRLDVLTGTAGSDWLVWAPGISGFDGLAGTDMVSFASATGPVEVDLGAGTARLDGGTLVLSGIENATGTGAGDYIKGDSGANLLRGLGGADLFVGTAGADRYQGGAGTDRVSYIDAAAGVSASLLRGTGFAGDAAGDVYDSIEWLSGSRFADTLTGGTGGDTLFGGEGDDTLTGNAGNDWLRGHTGTDVAVFSYARDQYSVTTAGARSVVEYIGPGAGDGTDTLDHVEILRFADGDVIL